MPQKQCPLMSLPQLVAGWANQHDAVVLVHAAQAHGLPDAAERAGAAPAFGVDVPARLSFVMDQLPDEAPAPATYTRPRANCLRIEVSPRCRTIRVVLITPRAACWAADSSGSRSADPAGHPQEGTELHSCPQVCLSTAVLAVRKNH